MSATIAAVKSRYDGGSSTLTDVPLWLDQAKDEADYPYAVMHDGGGPTTLAFGAGTYRHPRITIRGLHTSDSSLSAWQAAVKARFHRQALTITGATALSCILEDDYFRSTKARDKNGNAVYEATCIFRLEVETAD